MTVTASQTLSSNNSTNSTYDPATKFQKFPIFDGQECLNIIDGIRQNLTPDKSILKYHGIDVDNKKSSAYLLQKNIPELKWIYSKINPALIAANQQWGFSLDSIENIHMVERAFNGGTPEWHVDCGTKNTIRRKLSFSIILGEEYKEGQLQLWFGDDAVTIDQPIAGEMIVWPSHILTRTRNVRAGKQVSLNGWACGAEGFK